MTTYGGNSLNETERDATEKIALYLEMAHHEALRGRASRNRYYLDALAARIVNARNIAVEALTQDSTPKRS